METFPAGFVVFLYHVFVGLESLDVRYYVTIFCPKHGVTGDV